MYNRQEVNTSKRKFKIRRARTHMYAHALQTMGKNLFALAF